MNPSIVAFVKRALNEYRMYSATPGDHGSFVVQIIKMWASELDWTDSQLKKVNAPVLVVDGERDEAITREHTEHIASTIPGAGLLIMPNTGHFAFLDDMRNFNEAVLHFLGDR